MKENFQPRLKTPTSASSSGGRQRLDGYGPRLDGEGAETIAIAALSFLAEEPGRLGRFMDLTGLDVAEIQTQAGGSGMQAAVLDYLLGDETLLLVFAAEKRIEPEQIMPAYLILSGLEGGSGA